MGVKGIVYPPTDGFPRELVTAAQAGDRDAVRLLYAHLQGFVGRSLLTLTGSRAGLQDLGNEICARVLLNLRRYKGEGAFTSWVGMIVSHRFYRWGKLEARRDKTRADARVLAARGSNRPDDIMGRREALLGAAEATKRLPPRMFECFSAIVLRGDSPIEAARNLGGSPRAITNSAYRAKVFLRTELELMGLSDASATPVAKPTRVVAGSRPVALAHGTRAEGGGVENER